VAAAEIPMLVIDFPEVVSDSRSCLGWRSCHAFPENEDGLVEGLIEVYYCMCGRACIQALKIHHSCGSQWVVVCMD